MVEDFDRTGDVRVWKSGSFESLQTAALKSG